MIRAAAGAALLAAAALAGYAARPGIAELLAPEPVAPRAAEVVDLIGDVRFRLGERGTVDLTPLTARYGPLVVSASVDGDPMFPVMVSSDGARLELAPGRDRIGVFDAHLTGSSETALVTDSFRILVLPHSIAEIPPVVLDTALLDLPVRTLHLSTLAPTIWGDRAMGVLGNTMLIADSRDQFFRLDLAEEPVAMTPIALGISTNGEALHAFANGVIRGVAIHDILFFDQGRRLAVSYTRWNDRDRCVTLLVEATDVPADWQALAGAKWERLFESRPCLPIGDVQKDFGGHIAGGRLVEAEAGTLLLTVGSFDRDAYPEDPDADYGKVLAIGTTCCERRVVALGQRNSQGLLIDADGALWVTDQGPRGGDELNRIVPGLDYGWPSVTYGVRYDIKAYRDQPVAGRHEGYEKPVYAWVPSVAIGNIFQVRGFSKEWEGDVLANTLKAQELRRLRIEDGRVVYDEPIPLGARLRDSAQLADGRIVVLSDDSRLFILSPTAFPDGSTFVNAQIAALSEESRARVAGCRECHSIAVGTAPSGDRINLADIFGRDIASSPVFQYSPGLGAREGSWDARSLDEFLRDPQAFAPGTSMAMGGIADASVRSELVGFLESLRSAVRP